MNRRFRRSFLQGTDSRKEGVFHRGLFLIDKRGLQAIIGFDLLVQGPPLSVIQLSFTASFLRGTILWISPSRLDTKVLQPVAALRTNAQSFLEEPNSHLEPEIRAGQSSYWTKIHRIERIIVGQFLTGNKSAWKSFLDRQNPKRRHPPPPDRNGCIGNKGYSVHRQGLHGPRRVRLGFTFLRSW